MQLQIFDSESYLTWEEAEASGAVYSVELPNVRTRNADIDEEELRELILNVIHTTEQCIRYSSNIRARIGWEELKHD
jgi:hypothetical protein